MKHSPREFAGRTPTPERITTALDRRGLYGPEVDEALGGCEPMVDEWEAGTRVPTFEQIERLAALTGFAVSFFYRPPFTGHYGPIWLCGENGCEVIDRRPAAPVVPLFSGRLW